MEGATARKTSKRVARRTIAITGGAEHGPQRRKDYAASHACSRAKSGAIGGVLDTSKKQRTTAIVEGEGPTAR